MRKFIVILLFAAQLVSSQERQIVSTYHFGHNGMEFIAQTKKGMVIISTFNSKMGIREDIASKVYAMYLDNRIESNKKITVNGDEADVTGKCVIKNKNGLVVVDFYYETIEWCSGIKEIYKKKLG
jgi:hypothetical protein